MDGYYPLLFQLLGVAFLVFANGFFVAAEFAIVRCRPTRLKSDELKNQFGVTSSLALIEDLDLSLSATQIGITIASLTLGWWGESVFHEILLGWFKPFELHYASTFSHALAISLALMLITWMHVVIGELAAKSIAIRYPETTIRIIATPMLLFSKLCAPMIVFLAWNANIILRIFGIPAAVDSHRAHSPDELAMLVTHSVEQGILDKDEHEMLHGVFQFSETVAREVMTPRTDVEWIPSDATFEEVIAIVLKSVFSRFPVTGESFDDIKGILLARDIMPFALLEPEIRKKTFSLNSILREAYFIPGTKPIDDLLNEFKRRKVHMAIVLDEHGGVDGVVTLEDLLEEIVGEIFDESDIPERDIVIQENGEVIIDGGVLVSDLNSRFELNIPEGDYDTVGGFVFSSLGRIPKRGDHLVIKNSGLVLVNGTGEEALRDFFDTTAPSKPGKDWKIEQETNGKNQELEKDLPKAVLAVEKVRSNRIDSVRLKFLEIPETDESPETRIASQTKR